MAVAIAVIAETGAIVAIAMAAADPDAITGTANREAYATGSA